MKKFILFTVVLSLWTLPNLVAQNIWFNEIHYDNVGTDVNEFIEVVLENPGSYNLADFSIILYNGSGGASYDTRTLNNFTVGNTVGTYTFYYFVYPVNGIQNGSPDGMAIAYQGVLVTGQFLSYEGTFSATNGPANGVLSTDIGVSETSSTPIGQSLQLSGSGSAYSFFTWQPPATSTMGGLNNGQTLTASVLPEPTDYPTNFIATASNYDITLTWTDAAGTQPPGHYLIKGSDASNIINPSDGVEEPDDADLSDGTGILNIAQGVETCTFSNLLPNTTYYFKIFPYTNSGADINYKTDGTPPSAEATTACEPYPPEPNFWADKLVIEVGDSINFFDSTLYCPDTWNWSFVGGIPMTSNDTNPTNIKYYYPGVYTVCLTVTNQYGTVTNCKNGYITVNAPPAPTNARIVITEIMYNPPETGNDTLEFIELFNNDTAAVNLQGFYFSDGVDFIFPDYTLQPQDYVLVSISESAIMNTFGKPSLQWASGALSNAGELIRLKDYNGYTVDSVLYDDVAPWDSTADGMGPSLELCDPNADNSLGSNWRAAIEFAAVNVMGDTIWASPLAGCSYLPVADFEASDTAILEGGYVNFTDLSTGGITTWDWTFEGGTPDSYSGQIPPQIQYNTAGAYGVTLTVKNAVGENTKTRGEYIYVGPTGTGPDPSAQSIRIFPNPNNGHFMILLPGKSLFTIRIMDGMGRTAAEKEQVSGSVAFDLSALPQGIYMARVTDMNGKTVQTKKIIIQK
jgi:PKD repeat protein